MMGAGSISAQSKIRPLDYFIPADIVTARSTRRVRTSWTGYIMLVRRDSDNLTTSLAADPADNDFISLNSAVSAGGNFGTWMGSSNVYIVTKYDQGGAGNHGTNATAGGQPQIASAGVILKKNSRPFETYNGSSQTLDTASNSSIELDTTLSYFSLVNFAAIATKSLMDKRNPPAPGQGYHVFYNSTAVGFQWNSATTGYSVSFTTTHAINTTYAFTLTATKASTVRFYKSLTQVDTVKNINATGSSIFNSPLKFCGQTDQPALYFSGSSADQFLFNTVITEKQRLAIANNARNTFGIT